MLAALPQAFSDLAEEGALRRDGDDAQRTGSGTGRRCGL